MNTNNYIFKICMTRIAALFFTLFGGLLFAAGLDMKFFNIVCTPQGASSPDGFLIAIGFCFLVGSLLLFSGLQNLISPSVIIMATKQGIKIKSNPGPGRTLTLIPWTDIDDIKADKIVFRKGATRKVLKIILTKDAKTPKSKAITDGTVNWQNGIISLQTMYFSTDAKKVIEVLNIINSDPAKAVERNENFWTVANKYMK